MKMNEKQAISYLNTYAILLIVTLVLGFIPFGSIITFIAGIVGMIFLILAFKYLSMVDEKFKVPFIFLIIGIIGFILIFVGLFSMMGSALLIGSSSSVSNLSKIGLLTGSIAVVLLGVILAFLGAIIGVILGFYRIGKRYNDSKISIGAILLIIPLVDIVGTILIIIGLLGLSKRVQA